MKTFLMILSLFFFIIVTTNDSLARQKRVAQIPNGSENACANCHINPAGGGARNAFGQDVQANFLDGSGDVIWSYALAKLDSDGDGIPNGVELQDPNALWIEGAPGPGLLDRVRNPGEAGSSHDDVLTIQLEDMDPHLGQLFELKLFEQGDDSEKELVRIEEIFAADFSIAIFGIDTVKNYQVDFYADHNGNGSYDAPPDDHAWREIFMNTEGNYILEFVHNTEFTDINFPTAIGDIYVGTNPAEFKLQQNYPNPFNPSTTIEFSLPEAATVSLVVYNNLGQSVRTLTNERLSAGAYQVTWDGRNESGLSMSSGVYFYKVQAGSFSQVKRMIMIQ
jgi:hypothetical protein